MNKLHLLFNHNLTPEQKADAKASLGVEVFVPLPDDLQELWSNVPPEIECLKEYLKPILSYLEIHVTVGNCVLVQGDFGATYAVADFVNGLGGIPVYATTVRDVMEVVEGGGVVKRSVFRHVRFREYSKCNYR